MTPTLQIRSFTNDQFILDKVFYANIYRLKGFKDAEKQPVILDIGAHCGYFAFCALSAGAKRVYAFEPFLENYKALIKNVGDNRIGETISYQTGVYTQDAIIPLSYPKLTAGMLFDFANPSYSPEVVDEKVIPSPCVSLDNLLRQYVPEPVDILKFSIGYAEQAILANSVLKGVQHLCGEAIMDEKSQLQLRDMMGRKGFIDSHFADIKGETGKIIFHFSRSNCEEVFDLES